MRRTMVVLLVALAAVIGSTGPAGAVADGQDAPDGAYPFAVQLVLTGIPRADGSRYDSFCSGALVAAQWVATAGHCFHDAHRVPVSGPPPYAGSAAVVGRTVPSGPGGQVRQVVDVRQSPVNDLALARLDRPVTGIAPLAPAAGAPRVGAVLRLAGYGATTSIDPKPAQRLQTGQVVVRTVGDTTVGVVGYRPHADTSACPYDSGAPYFDEGGPAPTLVSVESTGPDCPHAGEETTARVDVALAWVRAVLGRR